MTLQANLDANLTFIANLATWTKMNGFKAVKMCNDDYKIAEVTTSETT